MGKMERMLKDLEKLMPYKDTIDIGDIILIAGEPDLLLYALVSDIERDTSRRDEWWHLKMQMLTMPPQEVVWTLRTPQMTGQEIFTMGGEKRFIKAVDIGRTVLSSPIADDEEDGESGEEGGHKKVSFRLV